MIFLKNLNCRLKNCSMLAFVILLFLSFICDCSSLSMRPEDYRSMIEKKCFNETVYHEQFIRGQWNPVGSSIDYLIRLIEKIEYHIPDPMILLPTLLRRFHFDGTKQQNYRNFQLYPANHHRIVNERIFSSVPKTNPFPEDILYEDEKCALYFMLSHTVNDTRPRKWTDPNNLFTGNEEIIFENKPYPRREVGTVSWSNSDHLAISTPPLLLGLAVGLFRTKNFSLSDSLPAEIDPLFGVTFSDKFALATLAGMKEYRNLPLFGMQGKWNSSICHTEFRLDENQDTGANFTMAELNGALLGWNIGRKYLYEDNQTPLRKLRLSTILKRFFSRLGLSMDCGICAQVGIAGALTETLVMDIKNNAKKFLIQWNEVYLNKNFEYERLVSFIEWNYNIFGAHIQKSSSILLKECGNVYNSLYGSSECETTSDIFIMLDNVQQYGKFQMEFIKNLLVRIQAANYLGRITILVNALRSYNTDFIGKLGADLRIPLHLLVYNTSSIQEATCRTAWYTWRESTIGDKKLLLEYLATFFERHNITNPHPKVSRNFFWLNMQTKPYKLYSEGDRVLINQYRWYLKYFLNLRTFFISTNDIKSDDNDIMDILLNQDDRIQVNPNDVYDQQIVTRLAKRVCDTPIPVIYDGCEINKNTRSISVNTTTVITPHRKQYWAIYPKHFLNSPLVTLKFRAFDAKIKVCLHRFLRPEGDSSKCLSAKSDGDVIEFQVQTPCRWKRVDNCYPIYFTVQIANRALVAPQNCLDDTCHGLEQIVWELSHSGLECSVGYKLYKHLSTVSSSQSIYLSSYKQFFLQSLLSFFGIILAFWMNLS